MADEQPPLPGDPQYAAAEQILKCARKVAWLARQIVDPWTGKYRTPEPPGRGLPSRRHALYVVASLHDLTIAITHRYTAASEHVLRLMTQQLTFDGDTWQVRRDDTITRPDNLTTHTTRDVQVTADHFMHGAIERQQSNVAGEATESSNTVLTPEAAARLGERILHSIAVRLSAS